MAEQLIAGLIDLFPDEIVVQKLVSRDAFGAATWAAGTAHPCRITQRQRVIKLSDGQELVSLVTAVFAGVFGVTTDDKYTLPARFNPRSPVPIAVRYSTDENGPHHERVFFSGDNRI